MLKESQLLYEGKPALGIKLILHMMQAPTNGKFRKPVLKK